MSPFDDLISIQGFDEELAAELRNRALSNLSELEEENNRRLQELGMSEELMQLTGLTSAMLVVLGDAGIKVLDDFGDLATDELISSDDGLLRDFGLSEEEANSLIMAARAHWFDDEPDPTTGELAPEEPGAGA